MTDLRILNLEPDRYSAQARAILQTLGFVDDGPLTREALLDCLPDYDVLIVRLAHTIDREVLDRSLHLKAIVSATTGLDHIDLPAAQERGVAVLSLRGEVNFLRSIPATAELTWGLLLALVRSIPAAYKSVLSGAWDRDAFRGRDLSGKTLGILGLGRIGEKVARYGQVFGMQVIAYDPYRTDWLEGVEHCAERGLLLAKSQVLSIHVPLNEETRDSLGEAELGQLPPGALLINTSRGEVLNEAALLRRLQSGELAGAALDVLQSERGERSRDLLAYARRHTNLLITPHIGGATTESMAATEEFMALKLKHYLIQQGLYG